MVQSLTLRVYEPITRIVLDKISEKINPSYLKHQLKKHDVPNQKCPECKTTTYDLTKPYENLPTSDLTLYFDGFGFRGSASGAELSDKLIVKAIALRGIQEILTKYRISSRLSLRDIDDSNYKRMFCYGLIKHKRKLN